MMETGTGDGADAGNWRRPPCDGGAPPTAGPAPGENEAAGAADERRPRPLAEAPHLDRHAAADALLLSLLLPPRP